MTGYVGKTSLERARLLKEAVRYLSWSARTATASNYNPRAFGDTRFYLDLARNYAKLAGFAGLDFDEVGKLYAELEKDIQKAQKDIQKAQKDKKFKEELQRAFSSEDKCKSRKRH